MTADLKVGDVFPWEPPEGIVGEGIYGPSWFILRTVSQKERAAADKLARHGVWDTWFPTETAWRVQRRSKRDRVEVQRLVAPGYLFACFYAEPIWHRVFDVTRGLVTGVVGVHGIPYAIPDAVLARMKQVPKRIEDLRREQEAREAEERAALQPRPGQRARLTSGPFAGMVVDVARIDRGIAAFLLEGIKGTAAVQSLVRVDEPDRPG